MGAIASAQAVAHGADTDPIAARGVQLRHVHRPQPEDGVRAGRGVGGPGAGGAGAQLALLGARRLPSRLGGDGARPPGPGAGVLRAGAAGGPGEPPARCGER